MAIVDRNELRAAADVQLALLIDVGTHTRLPQEADKDYRRQCHYSGSSGLLASRPQHVVMLAHPEGFEHTPPTIVIEGVDELVGGAT